MPDLSKGCAPSENFFSFFCLAIFLDFFLVPFFFRLGLDLEEFLLRLVSPEIRGVLSPLEVGAFSEPVRASLGVGFGDGSGSIGFIELYIFFNWD